MKPTEEDKINMTVDLIKHFMHRYTVDDVIDSNQLQRISVDCLELLTAYKLLIHRKL